ncbi:hypothetical protein DJ69_16815 [Halorubrum persicum]|uniref:Uncharacterized protein n=1 Tax=Halorubrum persicum TaxID=1383844 RepID=A0A2G1WES2_9EURY|nr:hypothetical protein DJ69_16815 [Halorubrum persicum]
MSVNLHVSFVAGDIDSQINELDREVVDQIDSIDYDREFNHASIRRGPWLSLRTLTPSLS